MTRLATLAAAEARLLVRDWTVLVFAFVFPPFVMLILAGVYGSNPSHRFGDQRPDDYYVTASLAVPAIALSLIGMPVALASYRDSGVLRRLEAFGVSTARVVLAQAVVTAGLIVIGAAVVLTVAAPTYGVPAVSNPVATVVGTLAGLVVLLALGVTIGLVAPTARSAQGIGLALFFPLFLLGGGGPPRGAMTGPMQTISDVLPSAIRAVTDPWLGTGDVGGSLVVLTAWGTAAAVALTYLTRRRSA
jgi:ABC-2 type transport system permease protein